MTEIPTSGIVLAWARNFRGLSETEASERLGISVEDLAAFEAKTLAPAEEQHLEVQTLVAQAQSSKMASQSEKAALWPTLQLRAVEQYQYPNAVFPESTWQGLYGVTVNLPLFEGNSSRNRSAQRLNESRSFDFQREQRVTDLTRDAAKALDTLASLKEQRRTSEENVQLAREVEKLTYASYRSGQARYLDVQDADVKLLQAEVLEAQLESAILSQTAIVDYLSAH